MTVVETVTKVLGTKKVIAFIVLAAALPFVIYALMASISIEPTPEFERLGWVKFNEPQWVIKQTIALYVLTVLIVGILLSWRHRLAIAMSSFALMLLTGIVDVDLMFEYMNVPVVLFLASMMFIVEVVKETGFLRYVVDRVVAFTHFEPSLLFVVTIVLSAVLAALVDEVTSILVVISMVISLTKALDIDPKPLLIAAVVATNIGSSATVIGNPVGVYLAFRAGLTFGDFLVWAMPAAVLSTLLVLLFFLRQYRGFIVRARAIVAERLRRGVTLSPTAEQGNVLAGGALLAVTLAGIATHNLIESALGLPKNALLLGISMGVAGAVLAWKGDEGRRLFVRSVDWSVILFFALLFAESAALESTGVSAKLAALLIQAFRALGPSEYVPVLVIGANTFIVAGLSAFLDNVVAVATAATVADELIKAGVPGSGALWWTVLIGSCYSGNSLPISSTANIVALSALESIGVGLSIREWVREVTLVTVATLLLGSLYISVLYCLSPSPTEFLI